MARAGLRKVLDICGKFSYSSGKFQFAHCANEPNSNSHEHQRLIMLASSFHLLVEHMITTQNLAAQRLNPTIWLGLRVVVLETEISNQTDAHQDHRLLPHLRG